LLLLIYQVIFVLETVIFAKIPTRNRIKEPPSLNSTVLIDREAVESKEESSKQC
jgi:hypothetical protein